MSATKTKQSKGFTAEEKAAMKERAKELKAEKSRAEGEKDLLTKIAEMKGSDRTMAKRVHEIVKATAPDRGTIVITDLAGVSAANDPFPEDGFGCMAIDSIRARCDFPSDGGLDAFLGAGDDVLATDPAQPGQLVGTGGSGSDSVVLPMGSEVDLRFRGNKGADVIAGASANDLLRGGPGADLLRGRAGGDVVNGKKGGDRLFGGSGDDSLHARHGDRDKRIDCARGADRAAVDRHIDPRPVGCEEVRRRS